MRGGFDVYCVFALRTFIRCTDVPNNPKLCRNVFQFFTDSFLFQRSRGRMTVRIDLTLKYGFAQDLKNRKVFNKFFAFGLCIDSDSGISTDVFLDWFCNRIMDIKFSLIKKRQ